MYLYIYICIHIYIYVYICIYIYMLTGLQKEDVIDSFEKRWLQAAVSNCHLLASTWGSQSSVTS